MLLQLRTRMLLQLLLPLSAIATKTSCDVTDGGERSAFNASSLQAYESSRAASSAVLTSWLWRARHARVLAQRLLLVPRLIPQALFSFYPALFFEGLHDDRAPCPLNL